MSGPEGVLSEIASLSPPHSIFDAVFVVAVGRFVSLSNVPEPGLALTSGATHRRRLSAEFKDPRGARNVAGAASKCFEREVAAGHATHGVRNRVIAAAAIALRSSSGRNWPSAFNTPGQDGSVHDAVESVMSLRHAAGPPCSAMVISGAATVDGARSSRRVAASADNPGRGNGASSGQGTRGPRCGFSLGNIGPNQDARGGSAGGDATDEGGGESVLRAAGSVASEVRQCRMRTVHATGHVVSDECSR